MQKIIKNLFKTVSFLAIPLVSTFSLLCIHPQSASAQFFSGIFRVHPANLALVENFTVTAGGGLAFFLSTFKGAQSDVLGQSTSNTDYLFPYGQIGYRIHPKIVIGLDITNPQIQKFVYTNGNLNGLRTILFTKNFSPKISYEPFDNLSIGAGLDVIYNNKANLSFYPTPGNLLVNKGSGTAVGADVGFQFKIRPTMLLTGTYSSRVNLYTTGTSTYNGVSTPMRFNNPFPDILTLIYAPIFSEKWKVELEGQYIIWGTLLRNLTIQGTPLGTLSVPLNYHNSWGAITKVRYKFAEKWASSIKLEFDSNPQPLAYRPVGFPADNFWVGELALQYMPIKNIEAQLLYGMLFLNTSLNNSKTLGTLRFRGYLVDLRLTYKF